MTVKELYEWAVEHGIEDYVLRAQYRDGGGDYCGDEDILPAQGWGGIVNDTEKTILV